MNKALSLTHNVHMAEVLSTGQKNITSLFLIIRKEEKQPETDGHPELFRVSGFCRTQGYAHILGLIAAPKDANYQYFLCSPRPAPVV